MKNQIIVAMDNEIPNGMKLIAKTKNFPEIYGYKIGSLWILDRGINILKSIRDLLESTDKKIILDMQKWGTDIPDIVTKQVNKVAPYVDELIVCPMGGGKQSLKAFANACFDNKIDPICVIEMTHRDANSYLCIEAKTYITVDAGEFGIKKFVIPATKISDFDKDLYKQGTVLYTTGLKAQGGQTKPMLDFGVTKFIVGRGIYEAEDPIKAIKDISKEINE